MLRRGDCFGLNLIVFIYLIIYCKIWDVLGDLDFFFCKFFEYKIEKIFIKDIEIFFEISKIKWLVL